MNGRSSSRRTRFATRFIRTYQLDVSHRLGARCGGDETCSDYALRMFDRHGFLVAGTKTLLRIARCRPPVSRSQPSTRRHRVARIRRVAATLGILGTLASMGLLFMSPASATVTSGCYGNANGRRFESITQSARLYVNLSQTISLSGGALGTVDKYFVRLSFFGIPYGMRAGDTTDNKWSGSVKASNFLTRGTGNYIVEGYVIQKPHDSTYCLATLYITVRGDPLSETPGQAAAGVTATAIIGMIATAVTGGKVPPGFEETTTPETEEMIKKHQEEEARKEEERKKKEEEDKKLAEEASKKCFFLILPALLLTAGMVASGAPTGSVGSRPIARWRPRLSFIGIGSGILFAVGSAVLLQQYGVIWPTLGMGITFLVGGLALGILVPTLARLRVVRKLNRRFAEHESRYGPAWGEAAETAAAEEAAAPAEEAAAPADWYPDPSGEARLRYWDGTAWTSDTAD